MKRSQNRARKTSVQLSAFRRQHATAHVSASMDTHSGYRGAYILLPQYIWACTLGALHIFGGVNLLIYGGLRYHLTVDVFEAISTNVTRYHVSILGPDEDQHNTSSHHLVEKIHDLTIREAL